MVNPVWATILMCVAVTGARPAPPPPRLIVWVTLDPEEARILPKLEKRLESRGLRKVLEGGTRFTKARQRISCGSEEAETAALVTGAYEPVPSLLDPESPGLNPDEVESGVSPNKLRLMTVGDWLHTKNPTAKIIALGLTPGTTAVLAGHEGRAFWISSSTGQREGADAGTRAAAGSGKMTSSRFYGSELPKWVVEQNAAEDDAGRTPDERLVSWARAAIDREQLGADAVPDLLMLSLEAPNATEEPVHRLKTLDHSVVGLLSFLAQRVRNQSFEVVVTARHVASNRIAAPKPLEQAASCAPRPGRIPWTVFGPGVPKKRVNRPVDVVDIAPTLAAILGLDPMPEATGKAVQ